MGELHEAGVRMFTDDADCVRSSPEVMRRAFEYASMFEGAVLSQHCEEHSMTKGFAMNEGEVSMKLGHPGYPDVAEELIIARDIMLAGFCGNRPYHVSHMSTRGGVELVRQAKGRGQTNITCEVPPHHFVLTDEAVIEHGTNAKMNPPLRTQPHVDAILEGFREVKPIMTASSLVGYAEPGWLIFINDGALMTQAFDPKSFERRISPKISRAKCVTRQTGQGAGPRYRQTACCSSKPVRLETFSLNGSTGRERYSDPLGRRETIRVCRSHRMARWQL